MSIQGRVRTALNLVLNRLGYEISRLQKRENPFSMHAAVKRMSERSLPIRTVIDIGASDGMWSKMAQEWYPEAFYFLIEANTFHEEGLISFKAEHDNVDYVLAAAGDKVGEIYFDADDPFGGVASHEPLDKACLTVPVTTVDEEVKKNGLEPPFLLKLDTHGFEVPILEGAEQALKETDLIVMETYNFNIQDDSLTFWEMCRHLYSKGFRPMDLCDPLHRPLDGSLWQVDFFFVRNDREEFRSLSYQ